MYKTYIKANLVGNMAFKMDIDGHIIITDTIEEYGGNDFGPSPKSLLLAGLIGCSGIDIMCILKKMKVKCDDVNIEIEAESIDEDPSVYEHINIVYKFKGKNIPYDKAERAVELSMEKYCPVAAMLKKAVPISYEIIIDE